MTHMYLNKREKGEKTCKKEDERKMEKTTRKKFEWRKRKRGRSLPSVKVIRRSN